VLRRLRQERTRERRARFAALPPEEQKRRLEARAARKRAARAALTPKLADPDPEVRRVAVAQLDADTEGSQRLVEILAHDPDPRVRAEAAGQLSYTDSIAGVRSLIRALGDPDPGVVAAAIDSLTFAGDASVVPDLRPLLEHADRHVRQAAARAIEFLK
jgi:HEAT repeat protein